MYQELVIVVVQKIGKTAVGCIKMQTVPRFYDRELPVFARHERAGRLLFGSTGRGGKDARRGERERRQNFEYPFHLLPPSFFLHATTAAAVTTKAGMPAAKDTAAEQPLPSACAAA